MSEWQTAPAIQMKLDSWRGYSAYEIAVRNGFEGTEAQWLESLRGEKGEVGDNITVNNKKAVGGNVSINATDIYMQPGIATETVAQAIEERMKADAIVDSLDSEETDKALSAAQGRVLLQQVKPKAEIRTQTAALPASGWVLSGEIYEQSAAVAGVTIDQNKISVIVSPPTDRAMEEAYVAAAVRASAQGDGSLTFSCTELPEIDLEAHVMVVVLGVTGE